ncbi:MAG: glycosyltransferase family 2 protein [Proteobacteria bacterium]|nr:glycosyltransferase family 2 protein [Pseudomonadota bacterium]
MPALNEERYIADAIASILPSTSAFDYELLVMDGGSTDETGRIVREISAHNPRVKLIRNPRRTQSAAMNIAADICDPKTTILLRADCHALYPPRFVENCVETLRATQSASVVVSMRAVGRTPLQSAIAAAQNSRVGNGGSRHRRASESGYVEHGHHAAFDRQTFRSLYGYDESAPFNEDAEFDARLIQSGGRIYLDGRSTIDYYPRASFVSLAKQYYRHGWGRANTLAKHGMRPKLRQALPVAVLLVCLASVAAWPFIGAIALLPPAVYVFICLAWGAALAVSAAQPALLLAGLAAITMHMSWAVGFLTRFLDLRLARPLRFRNEEA